MLALYANPIEPPAFAMLRRGKQARRYKWGGQSSARRWPKFKTRRTPERYALRFVYFEAHIRVNLYPSVV